MAANWSGHDDSHLGFANRGTVAQSSLAYYTNIDSITRGISTDILEAKYPLEILVRDYYRISGKRSRGNIRNRKVCHEGSTHSKEDAESMQTNRKKSKQTTEVRH